VDEVEDGGRAKVIEEGIAAMVYSYAEEHNFLKNAEKVDYDILRTIRKMVQHLEVSAYSAGDWEKVILKSYELWRHAVKNRHVQFSVDLDLKEISIIA
jgi:hypothetical protein